MSSSLKKAKQDCNSIKKNKYSLKFITEAKFLEASLKMAYFCQKDSEKVCTQAWLWLIRGAEEPGMLSYFWVSDSLEPLIINNVI